MAEVIKLASTFPAWYVTLLIPSKKVGEAYKLLRDYGLEPRLGHSTDNNMQKCRIEVPDSDDGADVPGVFQELIATFGGTIGSAQKFHMLCPPEKITPKPSSLSTSVSKPEYPSDICVSLGSNHLRTGADIAAALGADVSNNARKILLSSEFVVSDKPTTQIVIIRQLSEIGLSGYNHLESIYAAAITEGLRACSVETGPRLFMQFAGIPSKHERIFVLMDTNSDVRRLFTIVINEKGRRLCTAYADYPHAASSLWIFARPDPKPDIQSP